MALTGQAAGNCTVKATSSLSGAASATRTITVNNIVLNTVQCAPDAPKAGDTFNESIKARNNVYNMPRINSAYAVLGNDSAPDNPIFRDLKETLATYSYTTSGANIALNTTNVTTSGTVGYPPVPASAFDGYVPVPVWSGHSATINPDGAQTYIYNAAGDIVSVPKRAPSAAKIPANSNRLPVEEFIPADWQRTFAKKRDTDNTAAGAAVNLTQVVRIRTTGGWLGSTQFAVSGGSTGGSTYGEGFYNVTATFVGFTTIPLADPAVGEKGGAVTASNPKMDSAGAAITTAAGKLTYGTMCKFEYKFQKVSNNNGGTTQVGGDAVAWNGTSPFKADVSPTCTGWCSSQSSTTAVANGLSATMGDWKGTFYTHDKLPRTAKDYMTAIGRAGGQAAAAGAQGNANGNGAYFAMRQGGSQNVANDTPSNAPSNPTSGGSTVWNTTPPTNKAVLIKAVTRVNLP